MRNHGTTVTVHKDPFAKTPYCHELCETLNLDIVLWEYVRSNHKLRWLFYLGGDDENGNWNSLWGGCSNQYNLRQVT